MVQVAASAKMMVVDILMPHRMTAVRYLDKMNSCPGSLYSSNVLAYYSCRLYIRLNPTAVGVLTLPPTEPHDTPHC